MDEKNLNNNEEFNNEIEELCEVGFWRKVWFGIKKAGKYLAAAVAGAATAIGIEHIIGKDDDDSTEETDQNDNEG